ncbi:MAG: DNA phosphorothioation-dependent restriction protein DptG [Methylobacter sp.]|nr:DNA phosphorothioation-dependent restriction protein DptG [Methylobacter sp.]
MYLSKDLQVTNNKLTAYFPIRTKDERKEFDWDSILGMVISDIYRKELLDKDFEKFTKLCESEFNKRLDDPTFWSVLKEMYFDNQDALNIAPEFLLFKSEQTEENKHNQRIGKMFSNMLGSTSLVNLTPITLNFLEQIIYDALLYEALKPERDIKRRDLNEEVFLPFMADCFKQDLKFLSTKPRYLLENFNSFLKLYGFLYTSQLAHNLLNWNQGEPMPVPNYLILDVEKASQERREVHDNGYKQLQKHVHYLFPYLSMSEMLQGKADVIKPLWVLAESIRELDGVTNKLNEFAYRFVEERQLSNQIQNQANASDALAQVLRLSRDQFHTGNKSKDDINANFAKATLKLLCSDFIQHRGAAGATLVINQDYLLLLTNLVIGINEKLRLNELLKAFERRGVFFDKQSQAEIVQFYERIGNVERMSDSGDAVYVRKTV